MKFFSKKWVPPLILGACFTAIGALFIHDFIPSAHRITLTNASGVSLKNVTWNLTEMDHSPFITRNAAELKPGETIVIRHYANDTRSRLQYEFNGKVFAEGPYYIDLWAGECWAIDIQPDGTTRTSH